MEITILTEFYQYKLGIGISEMRLVTSYVLRIKLIKPN